MIVRSVLKQFSQGMPRAHFSLLKKKLKEILPIKQQEFKKIKQQFGAEESIDSNVEDTIDGLKGVHGLFWECSTIDPDEGVKYRGHSVDEIAEHMQKAPEGKEPLSEAMLWLLMTGELPKEHEVKDLSAELSEKTELPGSVEKYINDFSPDLHPMAQLSIALLSLQPNSQLKKAYSENVQKQKYWSYAYDDAIDIIAKLPRIAALIYRNVYKNKKIINSDKNLDWAANFAHMMGFERFEFHEAMRCYMALHCDNGGSIAEKATHLIGSTLSDPYLAYSAGINSMCGPLHGLNNKRVLRWVLQLQNELGDNVTDEAVKEFVLRELAQGNEIPGYGHQMLSNVDSRLEHFRKFAEDKLQDDPLFKITESLFRVVPQAIRGYGKAAKNPHPNVDALSGIIFHAYGLREADFYPVIFAVSRSLGSLSGLVWSRALSLPIEKTMSMDSKSISTESKSTSADTKSKKDQIVKSHHKNPASTPLHTV